MTREQMIDECVRRVAGVLSGYVSPPLQRVWLRLQPPEQVLLYVRSMWAA